LTHAGNWLHASKAGAEARIERHGRQSIDGAPADLAILLILRLGRLQASSTQYGFMFFPAMPASGTAILEIEQ